MHICTQDAIGALHLPGNVYDWRTPTSTALRAMRTETAVGSDGCKRVADLALLQPVLRMGPSGNVINRTLTVYAFR